MLSRRKALCTALASAAAFAGISAANAAGEKPRQSGRNVGTDRDLRRRVLAAGHGPELIIGDVMTPQAIRKR